MCLSQDIAPALLAWYDQHGRSLPWREDPSAYHTLLSEFMLQQTQVATVIPYYHAFLEAWPSLAEMAAAPLEDLRAKWAGLGYYRRVENLHRLAQEVVKQHGGILPKELKALKALPGVGDYTAGAIASIAYGQKVPAIDGNIRRLMARLYAKDFGQKTKAERKESEDALLALMPQVRPGDFIQALMDLGQGPCQVQDPHCDACPLAFACKAKEAGSQNRFPAPIERKKKREEARHYLLLNEGATLLMKVRSERLLQHFYEPLLMEDASGKVGSQSFHLSLRFQKTHVFTHKLWKLYFYTSQDPYDKASLLAQYPGYTFLDPKSVLLPVSYKRELLAYLSSLDPLC